MKIFLDTNVFYNDWYLRGANFKYLAHFLNNENHDLLISSVVIQETKNIRDRELAAAVLDLKKNLKIIERLNSKAVIGENDFSTTSYDLHSVLKEKVEGLTIIEYSGISHAVLVERVLKRRKPFGESGKGYRDALIWLSLLKYLEETKCSEEIIFVTENKSDFFDSKSPTTAFHPDLLEDLKSLGVPVNIKPYSALFDFVQTINKDEHAIDHTKAEELFGEYWEEEALAYLEAVPREVVSQLLSSVAIGDELRNIRSIRAQIWEGIEDFEVLSTNELDNGEVFVSCHYDLRLVELVIEIPAYDYHANKALLDAREHFYDVRMMDDSVTLKVGIRPYYTASFVYNAKDESLKGYSVSDFRIKPMNAATAVLRALSRTP